MSLRFFKCYLVIYLAVFCTAETDAQDSLTTPEFRNPVDLPMVLSGNFGEFRSNHFHTGIDIKTNGKTGYPVYAIADGWVRRIKTGPFSYGKVLYLDHGTGHTSVYAHLSSYNDTISSFLSAAQKAIKRNEVDVFPIKNRLPVKHGELIGYTGNTGRSGGPHLHFEVRTLDTEKPLNPLRLGFEVKDNVLPLINGVLVEHLSDSIRGKVNDTDRYYAKAKNGQKTISGIVKLSERAGLSVHTLDYLSSSRNPCGVYRIRLSLDGEQQYEMRLDSLDFSTNRYINAHKNYEVFRKEKSSFHRCFYMESNPLEIYSKDSNGIIQLSDNEVHEVLIEVWDAADNKSTLNMKIQLDEKKNVKDELVSSKLLRFDEANSLEIEGCSIRIPPRRLLSDDLISMQRIKEDEFSGRFQIGEELTPVQNYCWLSIKLENTAGRDSSKFFITRYDPKKGRYYGQGGEYKDGWIRTRVKQFGIYTIDYDETAPVVSWSDPKKHLRSGNISIKITDDNSGISSYSLLFDGEFIPLYYNYKSARLVAKLEEELQIKEGANYLLEVRDVRNNITVIEGNF